MNIKIVIEIIIGIGCVIFYLNFGIYIGKKYGSFEAFVLKILDNIKKSLDKKNAKKT